MFLSNLRPQAAVLLTGLWLLYAPSLFHFQKSAVIIHDRVSGVALVVLSLLFCRFKKIEIQWLEAGVGCWLLMAPLVLWAPTRASYISDTIAGVAVLVCTLLIPYSRNTGGEDIPPGWTYNPSAWSQRVPIVLIGAVAFFVAAYMAGYQLGHMKNVWDPFFGEGTRNVLESEVSKMFPVSDAGLGAVTYLLEALSGLMGDPRRWRTMPWVVLLFGFLVIPAGIVSIVLVILQPWAVGAWCTLCLISAFLCLITLPPAADEIVASVEFILQRKKQGVPILKSLFFGDVRPASPGESHKPEPTPFELSVPWNLGLSGIAGFWLLAAPSVLGITGVLANQHYLMGALVLTFAVLAMSEAARTARLMNLPLGVWILVMPWIFGVSATSIYWNDMLAGAVVIALTFPRGAIKERYGAWTRYII
jgi:uncharacterized membrane protein